jgi:branched-chain amino acid transport system substrate-binding protein
MKRWQSGLRVAGAALLVLVVMAIGGGALAGGPRATQAAGTITIGAVADETGAQSVYGVSIADGLNLADSEINAAGGVNGNKLNLLLDDSASSKEQVITLFQQLINQQHALAIIGPTLSSEAKVADPLAQKAGVPVLATSNTATGITQIGDYIFRDSLTEAAIIPVTVKTARAKLGLHRVAIIYGNDDILTKGEYTIFNAALAANGIAVTDVETFQKGNVDFSAQLTKIKGSKPDAIVACALAQEAANIMIAARRLGIPASIHFIGGNGFNSPQLAKIAGQAAEGAISGAAWFSGSKRPKNVAFIAAFTRRYGHAPDQFAAQAYDGLYILAQAIKNAHTTSDRKAVRDALAAIKHYQGATGDFSFTPGRDALEAGSVLVVKGGKFQLF